MTSEQRAPLAAFVVLLIASVVVLANALRTDAVSGLFVAPAQSVVAGAELAPAPQRVLSADAIARGDERPAEPVVVVDQVTTHMVAVGAARSISAPSHGPRPAGEILYQPVEAITHTLDAAAGLTGGVLTGATPATDVDGGGTTMAGAPVVSAASGVLVPMGGRVMETEIGPETPETSEAPGTHSTPSEPSSPSSPSSASPTEVGADPAQGAGPGSGRPRRPSFWGGEHRHDHGDGRAWGGSRSDHHPAATTGGADRVGQHSVGQHHGRQRSSDESAHDLVSHEAHGDRPGPEAGGRGAGGPGPRGWAHSRGSGDHRSARSGESEHRGWRH